MFSIDLKSEDAKSFPGQVVSGLPVSGTYRLWFVGFGGRFQANHLKINRLKIHLSTFQSPGNDSTTALDLFNLSRQSRKSVQQVRILKLLITSAS